MKGPISLIYKEFFSTSKEKSNPIEKQVLWYIIKKKH